MKTCLRWVQSERDDRIPTVHVSHNEHLNADCKFLTIGLGSEVIEIQTSAEGLMKIAAAISDHPEQMRSHLKRKIEAAQEEAKRLGVVLEEV